MATLPALLGSATPQNTPDQDTHSSRSQQRTHPDALQTNNLDWIFCQKKHPLFEACCCEHSIAVPQGSRQIVQWHHAMASQHCATRHANQLIERLHKTQGVCTVCSCPPRSSASNITTTLTQCTWPCCASCRCCATEAYLHKQHTERSPNACTRSAAGSSQAHSTTGICLAKTTVTAEHSSPFHAAVQASLSGSHGRTARLLLVLPTSTAAVPV